MAQCRLDQVLCRSLYVFGLGCGLGQEWHWGVLSVVLCNWGHLLLIHFSLGTSDFNHCAKFVSVIFTAVKHPVAPLVIDVSYEENVSSDSFRLFVYPRLSSSSQVLG